MCSAEETYKETKKAVEAVLFDEKDKGKSRLEQEMESAFFRIVGKWLVGGGVLVIIVATAYYFNTQSRIDKVEYQTETNSTLINEGGRYSQADADRDNAAFQKQVDDMNKKLDIIIEQTRN